MKSIHYQENSSVGNGFKPAAGSSVRTSELIETNSLSLSNNEALLPVLEISNVGDVILVCYAVGKRNLHHIGVFFIIFSIFYMMVSLCNS